VPADDRGRASALRAAHARPVRAGATAVRRRPTTLPGIRTYPARGCLRVSRKRRGAIAPGRPRKSRTPASPDPHPPAAWRGAATSEVLVGAVNPIPDSLEKPPPVSPLQASGRRARGNARPGLDEGACLFALPERVLRGPPRRLTQTGVCRQAASPPHLPAEGGAGCLPLRSSLRVAAEDRERRSTTERRGDDER